MAKRTVYLVVERALGYNDCFYDFTGAEEIVRAFRSRTRAERVARELSHADGRHIETSEPYAQNHHVIEAVIDMPD
jgi:hypothetical protein